MPLKPILYFFLFFITLNSYAQTDQADQVYKYGVQLKKEGKCSEAIVQFNKAVDLKPTFAEAFYELGWCYNELQRYTEAVSVLQRAKQIEPNNHKVIFETGFAKYKLGQIDDALEDYNKALTLNNSFAKAYTARANLFKDARKNTASALADYLKALEFDATVDKTYYWVGWCYNDLGRFVEALPYLQKAIGFEQQNYLAFSEIGFSYFSLNRLEEAVLHLAKANELKPNFETTLYYMGICYVRQNKKADALKKYNELVALNSIYAANLLNEIKAMK